MKAVKLRCEYLINPRGIDIVKPRLFWNCEGDASQTAYQVIVKDETGSILWDTGKVESTSMRTQYNGLPLKSRDIAYWQVRLWKEMGISGELSETAAFEIGLLRKSDWAAHWITGNYTVNKRRRYPVDYFKKIFHSESVTSARLYITACGLYEAHINGERVGSFILAPGITDYRKRVQYQAYDVTNSLKSGENVLAITLADGWYRGSVGAWGLLNQYGTETKVIAQLEITDTHGNMTTVCTDDSFSWSNDGPILFADNKDGERMDARKAPSYSGPAKITSHNVIPAASNNVEVNEHEQFKPTLIMTPGGKRVLDFGQNIAGYVTFDLDAHAGQEITMSFGELLDQEGEFTQKNIQCVKKRKTTPLQRVEYICKEGDNSYKTRFAIFGFRYVLVETDVDFNPDAFTAVAVYSSLEETGHFNSSNELLNQFVKNAIWSSKSNFADLPTDCPTRERHGWTGDAQIFTRTASYLFNFQPFARKYIRDMIDWQDRRGAFPQIAPSGGVDFYMNSMNGAVGWADAGVIMPYVLWKMFGDDEIIRKNYDALKRYAHFMMRRCGKTGILSRRISLKGEAKKYLVNKGQAYGEWAEPTDVNKLDWREIAVPQPEVSTAYTAYVMTLMKEIAAYLDARDDAMLYGTYADGAKLAYQALVEKEGYRLDTDRQAKLVRPLYFHLLKPDQTTYAKGRLFKAMENYGWRIGTGFLSTPLILDVLTEIDIESAYRLLENEAMPGWLFMPKNGATSIWESWEGTEAQGGIASLNHYSKGACVEWLFKVMCGIKINGENHFSITPKVGGHFTYAEASYDSIYGKVTSGWHLIDGKIKFTIHIPANCTADITLPRGERYSVQAGTFIF